MGAELIMIDDSLIIGTEKCGEGRGAFGAIPIIVAESIFI